MPASSRGKKNRVTVAEALRTHYRAPTGTVTGNNKSWLKSHRLDSFEEQIGAPLELDDRPANQFVAGFLRSPAMNFIPGTLRCDGGLRLELSNGTSIRIARLPVRPGGSEKDLVLQQLFTLEL